MGNRGRPSKKPKASASNIPKIVGKRGRPSKPKFEYPDIDSDELPKLQRGRPTKDRTPEEMPNYTGGFKVGDIVIFKFIGAEYKGKIYRIIEETDYAPLMFMIKSGDTNYPVRLEKIIKKYGNTI